MVITLQDACFFLAGIAAALVAQAATLRLRLQAARDEGYQTGTRAHLTGREAPLTKAIEALAPGADPEAIVACAAVFDSYLLGTHVKSASPFAKDDL